MDPAAQDVVALSVLSEPQRARIYAYLASARDPRTRQDLSEALGVGRTLVAFHCEKLEQAGLIQPVAADPAVPGRRGRPPLRYQVAQQEFSATVPPRRYELMAEILVQAASEQVTTESLHEAALRVGTRRGRALGAELRGAQDDRRSAQETLNDLLSRLGYEPTNDGDDVVLTNCPFQRLMVLDTKLVCSINAALAAGYLEGLGVYRHLSARLRPGPNRCCVVLERTA